jgi:hypothetical protein
MSSSPRCVGQGGALQQQIDGVRAAAPR